MTLGYAGTRTYQEFLDYSGNDARAGQAEMCRLLEKLLLVPDSMVGTDGHSQYAIQAPTGTGKSYAALLTGVRGASDNLRTVIGTSTLKLLSQYAEDIDQVKKVYPNVKFMLLRGADNYLCRNKAMSAIKTASGAKRQDLINKLALHHKGFTPVIPSFARADTDYCQGCSKSYKESEYTKTDCDYARARYQALQSDVVVTTHAMIAVDLKVDGVILGEVQLTIFDEAHDAHQYLSYSQEFSEFSLNRLMRKGVIAPGVMDQYKIRLLLDHFAKLSALDLYSSEETLWYAPTPAMAEEVLLVWPNASEISNMYKICEGFKGKDFTDSTRMVGFLESGMHVLNSIAKGRISGSTGFWMQNRGYRIAQMEVEGMLSARLGERRVAWISATLGTESKPIYVLEKAGLDKLGVQFHELESPFDYGKQLTYSVYTDEYLLSEIIDTVNRSGGEGGCLLLTTSHGKKNKVAEQLSARFGYTWGVNLRAQEDADSASRVLGNDSLVLAHKRACEEPPVPTPAPVLIGTDAFSAGLNLPMLCLTKLVIDGIRPIRQDRAYIHWRSRWLSATGRDGFLDYRLPEQAISLEQQIGRVIRSVNCRGTVVLYLPARDWNKGADGEAWKIVSEAFQRFPGMQPWDGEKITG